MIPLNPVMRKSYNPFLPGPKMRALTFIFYNVNYNMFQCKNKPTNREIIVNTLQTKGVSGLWLEVDFLTQIVILKSGVLGQGEEQENA